MSEKGGGKHGLGGWFQAALLLGVLIAGLVWIWAQNSSVETLWWNRAPMRLAARIAVVITALLAWFRTQSLIGARVCGAGIGDVLHVLSEPWNDALRASPRLANWLIGVSSGFIDLFGIFLIGAGLLGASLRPFLALLLLFVFRQLCQAACSLPIPPKMIWRNPGFPSLLVTYGVSNDFFISGHTAIAVLGAIEIARILPWWCALAAALVAMGEAGAVIVLRAHYTMDVLAAIAAAWCAADLAMRFCSAFGV
jgi:hypothetical protein